MNNKSLERRDFIKTCLTAAATAGSGPFKKLFSGQSGPSYDAKGLPTAILGKTGVNVPRIGIGLGSRFCAVEDLDK
ncbi:MAG: twin-arginine translocation signal domain-containing protein, partial [Candidatus Aminicenantes bacterium]|nr:twin-arginine translocation signal domain-containing protein [Candidatus Aminicenantes bacterium]